MPKIADLPELQDLTGDETVVMERGAVTGRGGLRDLVEASVGAMIAGNRLADVKALNIVPAVAGVTTLYDEDDAPIGFTVLPDQHGRSASILSYPLVSKAEIASLAGRTIHITGRYFASDDFLDLKPLDAVYVDIDRYADQTAGSLVYEGQRGNRLTRVVEYTVVGTENFLGLITQISLAAGAISDPATLRLESISYALADNVGASINTAIDYRAAGRFGASLSREAQPAIGALTSTAEFIRDPVTNFINGYRTPAGVNSNNSSTSWYWLMAPEDFSLLRGARVRVTVLLATSANYSRKLNVLISSVNRAEGGGALGDQNILSVRKYADHQVFVIEGLVYGGAEQIVASVIDQTDAASVTDEHVSVADVQIEIMKVADGSIDSTQATLALQRNITARTSRALPVDKVKVASAGGDYARLSDALDNATAGQIIEVEGGAYTVTGPDLACFPTYTGAKIAGAGTRPKYNFAQPASTTPADVEAHSASDFHLGGEVSNIHFTAQNARYASHPDAGGQYFNQRQAFSDCIFEHLGNEAARAYQVGLGNPSSIVWSQTYAVGLGTGSGGDISYDRCQFLGYNAAAFYAHSWGAAARPARIRISNSILDPQVRNGAAVRPYSFMYENLGSGQPDVIELTGNTLVAPIAAGDGVWQGTDAAQIPANRMTFSITGHGNRPAAYVLEDGGSRALRITSASTGTASTVGVGGTAAAVLFGTSGLTAEVGAVGLKGSLYGWLDVGDHVVGPGANLNITQLGKRLGNCTSVNKLLTVSIDGGALITITFNQNHTNQSNAAVLAIINAALGAAATADLFNVNELFRPRFTDEETRVYNAGATTILRKRAVARISGVDAPNARVMTDTDPAELFVGIAYEDIKPGAWGRVKSAGCIRALIDLARTDAAAFVAGDTFGVSDGGGQFAKGAAVPLLTAISAVDLGINLAGYATQGDIADLAARLDSALSETAYRPTLAEAVAELPAGTYFNSDDQAGAGPHPGVRWIYERTATSPFYAAIRSWANKNDVGLDQVANLAPNELPVSAAAAAELNKKVVFFSSRSALIGGAAALADGAVAHDGLTSYVKDGGSSIADLPGLSPFGPEVNALAYRAATDAGIQEAINRAIDAVSAAGGGKIVLPNFGQTYALTGPIIMKSNVSLDCNFAVLRLADNVNDDMIRTQDFYDLAGTNNYSSSTQNRFAILNAIFDDNAANQSPADPDKCNGVAVYGYGYRLDHVYVKDAKGHGFRCEWGQYGEPRLGMEAAIGVVKVDRCGRHGMWFKGPHDTMIDELIVIDASREADGAYCGFRNDGFGSGMMKFFHGWHTAAATNRVAYQIDASNFTFMSVECEGGRAQIRSRGNCGFMSGVAYAPYSLAPQIVLDGARNTGELEFTDSAAYPRPVVLAVGVSTAVERNQIRLVYGLQGSGTAHDLIQFGTDNGGNSFELHGGNASSAQAYSGTVASSTELKISQAYTDNIFIHLKPRGGLQVRYSGWGARSARIFPANAPGSAIISWNGNYASESAPFSQDDPTQPSQAMVMRGGAMYFLSDPAGATSPNVRGGVDSSGGWWFGGANAAAGRLRVSPIGVAFNGKAPVAAPVYGAPTGTATRTAFDTETVTLPQLAERLKALIDDLRARGDLA